MRWRWNGSHAGIAGAARGEECHITVWGIIRSRGGDLECRLDGGTQGWVAAVNHTWLYEGHGDSSWLGLAYGQGHPASVVSIADGPQAASTQFECPFAGAWCGPTVSIRMKASWVIERVAISTGGLFSTAVGATPGR